MTLLYSFLVYYLIFLPSNTCMAHIPLPTPCHEIASIEYDQSDHKVLNVFIASPLDRVCIQLVKPVKIPVPCSIEKINIYLDGQFLTDKVIIYPRGNNVLEKHN